MGYLGTKPSNSPLTSELIPDGLISTSDLANGAVTQDKLSTYIAPKGTPAFSAYLGSSQNISSATWTKVQLNTEEFDTASAFDSTTNYRFTPTVAGYYQINGAILLSANTTFGTGGYAAIWKNGTQYKVGGLNNNSGSTQSGVATCSSVIYFNGSTDYVELYGYIFGGSGVKFDGGISLTYFNGAMVRAA